MCRGNVLFRVLEIAGGDGFRSAKILQLALQGLETFCNRNLLHDHIIPIADLQLVERQCRQIELRHAIIALDENTVRHTRLEGLKSRVLLLRQLVFKMLAVRCVQIDRGRLFRCILNLSHASAGRLQDHLARTIAVLRKNDPGETTTIPALLADLNKQNDALL